MDNRPLLKLTLAELYQLADESWSDARALDRLLEELRHRTTARAFGLRNKIELRIRDFAEVPSAPSPAKRTVSEAPSEPEDAALRRRVAELNADLREARKVMARLREELARATETKRQEETSDRRLFAKVGLAETAPAFVVKAVRTAFRKAYHPDHRPAAEKAKAESQFKDFEQVFDAIEQRRK